MYFSVKKTLKEFGVHTEEELREKLMAKNWTQIKCSCCGREIDLMSCNYLGGDPVCKVCYND